MDFQDSIFSRISSILTNANSGFEEIYLVGGSIRDNLLGKRNFDLDFVMEKQSIKAAKLVADDFNGDFYVLDGKRGTARAIVESDSRKEYIDFARFNGQSIYEDLANRDFTINALAINIAQPEKIIDPLLGKKHLEQKILCPCSGKSFINDPVRILRAIRFLGTLDLSISETVIESIRNASESLSRVSNERIRDELFRILANSDVAESLHRLVSFNIFDKIFPELVWTQEEQIGKLLIEEAYKHQFDTASNISQLLNQICNEPNVIPDEYFQQIEIDFKKIKSHLRKYIQNSIHPTRGIKELIIISALFLISPRKKNENIMDSDSERRTEDTTERAVLARKWCKQMALSKTEIDFISRIVDNQEKGMESINLVNSDFREKIYKFYKYAGKTGVAQCLLYLANLLAVNGGMVPPKIWKQKIQFIRFVLEANFLHKIEYINPPVIINGNELVDSLKIERGPQVGKLLEEIRIAQVSGKVNSKQQAIDYCWELIKT